MSEEIRGLKIEISANGAKFKKTMKELRGDAKSSQAELNALQKSLELEFDEKKFARAQKVAQEAIDATAQETDALRERLEYLKKSGKEDTPMFRETQKDLAKAELKAQELCATFEKIKNIKLDNLAKQFANVGNKISGVGKALAPLSTGAAAALTGLGALGLGAAATGGEIDDLSKQFGLSAEKVQEWQYVALQTGVDIEVFNKALVKARGSMLDLATGTENDATKALQALGLSMEQFDNQEDMFDGVMAALGGMKDKTLQAAYANEIFGDKIANQMIPYLNAGAEEIAKLKEEFSSMGALSGEQVKALAELDDTFNLIKGSLKNVALQIGASLLPIMQKFADIINNSVVPKLQQLSTWFNALTEDQQAFMIKALAMVAALAPVLLVVGKLTSGIGGIIQILPKLSAGLSTLAAHPIIAIIGVIAMIIMLLYTTNEKFRESINALVGTLSGALAPILDLVMGVLQTIMGLLSPLLDILGNMLATVINIVIGALQPFFDMLSIIFELLQPLIQIALIPLQMALAQLSIPLQLIGTLLGWLAPLFTIFANIVKGAFSLVLKVINMVLGAVEDAINWCIDKINTLIDGVNSALGWLGVNIGKIGNVSLKIKTEGLDDIGDIKMDTAPPPAPDTAYDKIDNGNTSGDTINNDYSNTSTTQNVTVTIQNYAEEVDVDALVREINIKLAEAM